MVTSDLCVAISSELEPKSVRSRLNKLHEAVSASRSRVSCLRSWSEFIRERDAYRCVDCHSQSRLSAHHICRKSLFNAAQFDTGNGITLCRECHKEVHAGFNGRSDLSLPFDAQGGEKLASMERLYRILLDDAVERELLCEDFYFLSDEVLGLFKRMQGYDLTSYFPGSRLEQAFLILAAPEFKMRQAIAAANGFNLGGNSNLPGQMMIVFDGEDIRQSDPVISQGNAPWSNTSGGCDGNA